MTPKIVYKTTALATGGREGRSRIIDGNLDVELTMPKAIGGAGGEGTDPEQLFAVGYSACFLTSMKVIAGREKSYKLPENTTVGCEVGLFLKNDGSGYSLDVSLNINLPGMDETIAKGLVIAADKICPYSNATRGNIAVHKNIV